MLVTEALFKMGKKLDRVSFPINREILEEKKKKKKKPGLQPHHEILCSN